MFFRKDSVSATTQAQTFEAEEVKTIYLAGGCFWGVDAYFSLLPGVKQTISGYANGNTPNPSYEDVSTGKSGYAETVEVKYDPREISLSSLIRQFFSVIDATSLNKQGNDVGSQYRSGIYYLDSKDEKVIKDILKDEQNNYEEPIVTEVIPLQNFYPAEEYHQKYLQKNPGGYCHIDLSKAEKYSQPSAEDIRQKLSPLTYEVTQENATEEPFSSPYNYNYDEGIYVDIITGEPLFSSTDKFDSGSGWPSFTAPINKQAVKERTDKSYGMTRTEVRSQTGDSHLGHVFSDGPYDKGGKRYCINGAALRFIPKEEMSANGYGEYLYLFK